MRSNLLITVQNLKYKTISFYCLKCKNNTESIQQFPKLKMIEQYYHQNVLYVVVKNQDLFQNKKQMEYCVI